MKEEILNKLDNVFLKTATINQTNTSVYICKFIEKVGSNYNFAVFIPFNKDGEIVYQVSFQHLNDLSSLLPLKNIYERLIITPSKVLLDLKTKIGIVTFQNSFFVFNDEKLVKENLVAYNLHLNLQIKTFENEQKVIDDMFEKFLQTSRVLDNDYILDVCTQKHNFCMEKINQLNACANDVKNNYERYYFYVEKLKHLTPEKDYRLTVEKSFGKLLKDIGNFSCAIETCKQKFNRKIIVDINNIEELKKLSYDDKRYILIADMQNLFDFDVEAAKDIAYEELNKLYPILLRLLKSKGIISEEARTINNKYSKLTKEKGIDFSKLN